MEFYYNFNTHQTVNPLDSITHFYVNPYLMESFKSLNLDVKIGDKDVELCFQNGLPLIIIPIEVLDLSNVQVKMTSDGYIISKRLARVTQKIYVKLTNEKHIIRIDSVFNQ